jgi:hypothetical protein
MIEGALDRGAPSLVAARACLSGIASYSLVDHHRLGDALEVERAHWDQREPGGRHHDDQVPSLVVRPRNVSCALPRGVLKRAAGPEEPASRRERSPDPGPSTLGAGSEALPAGTYVLDLDARGSGDERFPLIRITVPDGWTNIDDWAVNSGEGTDHWVGITFWDVDEVYTHPCQWKGRRIQPGPPSPVSRTPCQAATSRCNRAGRHRGRRLPGPAAGMIGPRRHGLLGVR